MKNWLLITDIQICYEITYFCPNKRSHLKNYKSTKNIIAINFQHTSFKLIKNFTKSHIFPRLASTKIKSLQILLFVNQIKIVPKIKI